MAQTGKNLGQSRPSGTSATQVYSPAAGTTTFVRSVSMANTTGTAAQATVYIDINGSTYDADSMVFTRSISANDTVIANIDQPGIVMDDRDGNIAVKQGTGNAVCFTISGIEIT